jgi:hypothetical protein
MFEMVTIVRLLVMLLVLCQVAGLYPPCEGSPREMGAMLAGGNW